MRRKICIVTGSRAEYGLLFWLMKEIQQDPDLQLQVVITAQHLSEKFGLTYKIIEQDGFDIDYKVSMPLENDSNDGIAKAVGISTSGFSEAFSDLKPDVVVVLGDRFEVLAAATAASILKIPIAHIHGGESTAGAFDESFRHAVTKLSYLHFAAAEKYRKTIIQMGEHPGRVFCVGAPGLDHVEKTTLLEKKTLEESLELSLHHRVFLVTFHPVTLEENTSRQHIEAILNALDDFKEACVIFTGANADPDNAVIYDRILSYVAKNSERARFFVSLGQVIYLSLLKYVDVVIGNSSSGVIEVPLFKKPTINIGDRQKGRLMAESIIQCEFETKEIARAIQLALSDEFQKKLPFVKSLYVYGDVSRKIKEILKNYPLSIASLKKSFYYVQ